MDGVRCLAAQADDGYTAPAVSVGAPRYMGTRAASALWTLTFTMQHIDRPGLVHTLHERGWNMPFSGEHCIPHC